MHRILFESADSPCWSRGCPRAASFDSQRGTAGGASASHWPLCRSGRARRTPRKSGNVSGPWCAATWCKSLGSFCRGCELLCLPWLRRRTSWPRCWSLICLLQPCFSRLLLSCCPETSYCLSCPLKHHLAALSLVFEHFGAVPDDYWLLAASIAASWVSENLFVLLVDLVPAQNLLCSDLTNFDLFYLKQKEVNLRSIQVFGLLQPMHFCFGRWTDVKAASSSYYFWEVFPAFPSLEEAWNYYQGSNWQHSWKYQGYSYLVLAFDYLWQMQVHCFFCFELLAALNDFVESIVRQNCSWPIDSVAYSSTFTSLTIAKLNWLGPGALPNAVPADFLLVAA